MMRIAVRPRLIAITDTSRVPAPELPGRLEPWLALAAPGQIMVQLRDKELPIRERLALGRAIGALARRTHQLLQVNDRLDLAQLLEADALHLGEQGVHPADARRLLPGIWISKACHVIEGARLDGADALLLSPVLAPRKGNPALGCAALTCVRRVLPDGAGLYALGGIDVPGAQQCLAAGADGVAAIGSVLDVADPRPLLRGLGALR